MLTETLLYTFNDDKRFPRNEPMIVAVSGGLDSMVLLHALCHLPQRLFQVHVVTINHQIRPEGADDVAFVQTYCQGLNVPCTVGVFNVPAIAENTQQNLEATAREVRYDFLAQTATQVGANIIMTAHHATDQAETIILHVLRGTGLRGLQGMLRESIVPNHPHLRLVRPLLMLNKAQLLEYATQHHIPYCLDSTNDDVKYLRNKVRHTVMPILKAINPNIEEALLRLADIVRVEQMYMFDEYSKTVMPHLQQTRDRWSVPLLEFREWHEAIQRLFLQQSVEHLHNSKLELTHKHIQDALLVANYGVVGNRATLPHQMRVRVGYDRLSVERSDAPLPMGDFNVMSENEVIDVQVGQTVTMDGWQLTLSLDAEGQFDAHLAIPEMASMRLRTRKAGDTIMPLGMGRKRKKVKEWMIDHKIPEHVRGIIPLFEVNDEIAAILLPTDWAIAEPFAVYDHSTRVVYFSIQRL